MKLALVGLFASALLFAQGGGTTPGGSSSSVTYYATYKLDGGTATQSNQTYTATAADTSAVWVANSGALTLVSPILTTSGKTSSTDNSSFYGLNAGLLVTSGSATVTGGTITTSGTGANGAFAYSSAASLTLTGTTINATGDGGHAIMTSGGGSVTATNLNMTTTGGSASAIATDRGGGTITVTGGTVDVAGNNSADIYSTGKITVSGATMRATGAECAVIEGANSITLTDTSLTTTKDNKWGVMIYQSMSGDASGTQGTFTMTGGSLTSTAATGPLFYVNNSTGIVNLKNVTLSAASNLLVKAAAGSWGNSGSNGGNVVLTADSQTLPGDMTADSISTIAVTLKNNSTLSGKLTKVSLSLDASSLWSAGGNSVLTSLTDTAGISGTSIANIRGNGYTVTYDSSLPANSYLGGKTYSLVNGGTLLPAGSSTSSTAPAIASAGVVNAASSVAGVAPAAWISIYGTNLSTAATAAGSSDLVNGSLPTTLGGTSVTIDGQSAFMNYVSPAQLNVQAPNPSTSGNVTVTVSNGSGSSSATVAMTPTMPGVFTTASNYVLAVRPSDGAIINGDGSALAGYTTAAAAKPGDVLEIFATGLGATSPAVAPGLVFSGAYATAAAPAVSIGGQPATVLYSGLIGAGLYQLNITVPGTLAAGTYPVVVTQSSVSSPSTAQLKIAAN
jgi:uncharacterized protein (TIGR03437 family)